MLIISIIDKNILKLQTSHRDFLASLTRHSHWQISLASSLMIFRHLQQTRLYLPSLPINYEPVYLTRHLCVNPFTHEERATFPPANEFFFRSVRRAILLFRL